MEIISFTVIVLLSIIAIAVIYTRTMEIKNYNNGKCPYCNHNFRFFDTDSQGGRGYICDECGYVCWVSYLIDSFK